MVEHFDAGSLSAAIRSLDEALKVHMLNLESITKDAADVGSGAATPSAQKAKSAKEQQKLDEAANKTIKREEKVIKSTK